MGEWQKLQRTLHGRLCAIDLVLGSYHSRLWWPFVKLMSVFLKMAAHWKGAAVSGRVLARVCVCVCCDDEDKRCGFTMLRLTGGAMAQLRVERLVAAELVLDLAAVARGLVDDGELVVVLVDPVRRAGLPLVLALGGLASLVGGGVTLS